MATQTARPLSALVNSRQPYIGRRTGKVINISAKKDVHGYENISDYFPDSDSDDETTISKSRTVTENNDHEPTSSIKGSRNSPVVSHHTASENNGPTSDEDTTSGPARSTTSDNLESECSPDSAIGSNKEDDEIHDPSTSNGNHQEHEAISNRDIPHQMSNTVVGVYDVQSTVDYEDCDLHNTKKRLQFSPYSDPEKNVKDSSAIQKQLPTVQNEDADDNIEEEDEYMIVEKSQTTKSSPPKRKSTRKTEKDSQPLVENDDEVFTEDKRKSNDTFLTLKKKSNSTLRSNVDSYISYKSISMQSVKPSTSTKSKIPVRKNGKGTRSQGDTSKRSTTKRKAQQSLESASLAKKPTTSIYIQSSGPDSKAVKGKTRAQSKQNAVAVRASKRNANQKRDISSGKGLNETGPTKAIVASKRKASSKKTSESVSESGPKAATVVVSARKRTNKISESEDESGPKTTRTVVASAKRKTNKDISESDGASDPKEATVVPSAKRKANKKNSSEADDESGPKTTTTVASSAKTNKDISESDGASDPKEATVVPSAKRKANKKNSSEADDESGLKTTTTVAASARRKANRKISESDSDSGPKEATVVPSARRKASKKNSSEADDESGPKTTTVAASVKRKTNKDISESDGDSDPKEATVVPSARRKASKKNSSEADDESDPKTTTVAASVKRKTNKDISESDGDSDPKEATVVRSARRKASKKNSSEADDESGPKTTTTVAASTRKKTNKDISESDGDSDPKEATVVRSKGKASKKNSSEADDESGPKTSTTVVASARKKTNKKISESDSESSDESSSSKATSRMEKDDEIDNDEVDECEIDDDSVRSDVGAEMMDQRDASADDSSDDDGAAIRPRPNGARKAVLKSNDATQPTVNVEDSSALKPPKNGAGRLALKRNSSGPRVDVRTMEDEQGPRRSHRNRVPPLQYWKNERINYERRMSGWVVKDVIVNPSPSINIRKRKITTKASTHKAKKGARVDVSAGKLEEWELSQSNVSEDLEEDIDPVAAVINPDTMKEVKMKVLHSRRMLDFQSPVGTEGADAAPLLMHKYFSHKQFGTGQILLRPGVEKGRQHVRRDTMIFHILSGRVQVSIHNHSFVLAKGSSFFVPEGNVYNIKNVETNKDACLFFTQLKG